MINQPKMITNVVLVLKLFMNKIMELCVKSAAGITVNVRALLNNCIKY